MTETKMVPKAYVFAHIKSRKSKFVNSRKVTKFFGNARVPAILFEFGFSIKSGDGKKRIWSDKEMTLKDAETIIAEVQKRSKAYISTKSKKTTKVPAVIKETTPVVQSQPLLEMDENAMKGFGVFQDMVLEAGRAGGKEVAKTLLSQQTNLLIEVENKKEAFRMFFKHILPDMIVVG